MKKEGESGFKQSFLEHRIKIGDRILMGALLLSGCQQPTLSKMPNITASEKPSIATPSETTPGAVQTPAPKETTDPAPTKQELEQYRTFFQTEREASKLTSDELVHLDIRPEELSAAIERLKYSRINFPGVAFYFNNLYYKDGINVRVKYHDLAPERRASAQFELATGLGNYAHELNRPLTFVSDDEKANLWIGFNKTLSDPQRFAETSISGWTRYDHPQGTYALGARSLIMFNSDFIFPQYSEFNGIPTQSRSRVQDVLYNLSLSISAPHEIEHTEGYVQDHDTDPLSFMAGGHNFHGKFLQSGETIDAIPHATSPHIVDQYSDGSTFFAFVEQYDRARDPAYQAERLKEYLFGKLIAPNPGKSVEYTNLTNASPDWEMWKKMSE